MFPQFPSSLHSRHGILSNFIWIPNANQQNFFCKQIVFSSKASDSTTKILTASERGCYESDNYGFSPISWFLKERLTENWAACRVQSVIITLKQMANYAKKKILQLISFF